MRFDLRKGQWGGEEQADLRHGNRWNCWDLVTSWTGARTKEAGSCHPWVPMWMVPVQGREKTGKSEPGDNAFDFSAFESGVTRRHTAQRNAQDWSKRSGGSVAA